MTIKRQKYSYAFPQTEQKIINGIWLAVSALIILSMVIFSAASLFKIYISRGSILNGTQNPRSLKLYTIL